MKTLQAVVGSQQRNQARGDGESFIRERASLRINLALERPAGWFLTQPTPKADTQQNRCSLHDAVF
jgi:hypothetical protein